MDSIRVSELAKELGLTSKEVIEKFAEVSIVVKSHSNTVTPTQIRKLKEHLGVAPKKNTSKPKAFVVKKAKAAPVEEKPQKEETVKAAPTIERVQRVKKLNVLKKSKNLLFRKKAKL